jgi:putative ABC transport system permease protein
MRLRLSSRLAWRELRARPWRSALVAALVAVPVAGMVVFSVAARSYPANRNVAYEGHADVIAYQPGPDAAHPDGWPPFPAEQVFPGSAVARIAELYGRVRTTDGHRATASLQGGDLDAPVARGIVHVLDGRLPRRAGEVALSPSAKRQLHVRGDRLHLSRPELDLRVVGTAVEPLSYGQPLLVLHELPTTAANVVNRRVLVDLPSSVDPLEAVSRTDLPDGYGVGAAGGQSGDGNQQVAINWSYVVGSLVLLVAGIVIAAAFAVGARRQLRVLGLLAANGAPPSVRRDVLLVEGALCGLAGVVAGGALAAVLLAVAAPHRDRLLDRVTGGWALRPVDLVPIAVIGIVAAVLASVQPARSASRLSVLRSLAGQGPAGRVAPWVVPVGAAGFVAGVGLVVLAVLGAASGPNGSDSSNVWTITAILGGVGIVLGGTALAPAVVQRLEPLVGRLRGTWRLGARSLARSRARSSAVVAALAAAAALAIAGSSVALSIDEHDRASAGRSLPDDVVDVSVNTDIIADTGGVAPSLPASTLRRVADVVGATEWVRYDVPGASVTTELASSHGPTSFLASSSAAVGSPDLVRFLGAGPQALDALRAGDAVVLDAVGASSATVAVTTFPRDDGGAAPRTTSLHAVVVDASEELTPGLPRILLPASRLADFGTPASRGLVRAPDALTQRQRDALADLRDDLTDAALDQVAFGRFAAVWIIYHSPHRSAIAAVEAGALGAALGFTLLVLAIGLGLSAAESRAERDVLVAVGASPRATGSLAAVKAATLAAVGAALAVPMALVPVAAWGRSMSPDYPFRPPWLVLVALVVGVPVVAGVATWVCSAVGGRVRPVRASTFAVD